MSNVSQMAAEFVTKAPDSPSCTRGFSISHVWPVLVQQSPGLAYEALAPVITIVLGADQLCLDAPFTGAVCPAMARHPSLNAQSLG